MPLRAGCRLGTGSPPVATEEGSMPLVNVKLLEGVFDAERKRRIVRDLTEAMVAIEGENMRPVTWAWSKSARAATGGSPATR
jgi:4-oxalocrotonate tautomerase